MDEKKKHFGYIRAVEAKYGICPTISGATVILAIVYVFMNAVDLFKVIQESQYKSLIFTMFVVSVGLIGGALLTWLIIKSFRPKTALSDPITMMLFIVGIGSCGIKYLKDGINLSSISNEYFVFLGVSLFALILIVIHSIRFKSELDDYVSYKPKDVNSSIGSYYKELFNRFEVVWLGILAILSVAAIFLIDANESVPALAESEEGKKIIYILSGVAVICYLIGIIQRLVNKRINVTDIGIFMMLVASICAVGVSAVRFVNNLQDLPRLIIAIAALVFSLIASLLFAKGTYIPSIGDEEEEEDEEVLEDTLDDSDLEEEVAVEETEVEEVLENDDASEENEDFEENQPVVINEDMNMAEQIKEIIERLNEQTKVNTSMNDRLMNIDRNIQLIADILSGLSQDAIPTGTQSIQVPMQEVEEVPVAMASLDEEVDYFEQIEQEKQVEETNAQIAEEFAEGGEENDFLATADDNVKMKPKLSFEMKLRNASDDIKKFYSDIKNELLSYGIHDRISRHRENFNQGRINICRMVINGKTLKVYLAVDPESIDKRYFHHSDVGHRKGLVELPTMINVRSKVSARKVKELISLIMESLVISKKNYEEQDFAKDLTLDGFTTIEAKGFSHLVKDTFTKEEAESYPDTFAQQLIEVVEDEQYQEKFIKTELTLDEIVKHFKDGDVVDVAAVRAKGLGAKNTNYLSVKESESLSKKLKVYANEFTPNAVKMICLSGGEAFVVMQPEKTIEEA